MYIYIPWGHGICDKFIYLQCTVAWVGECPCVNLIVHMAHAGQRERNWTIISHANHLVVSTKLSCLTWVLYILSQSILQKLSGNQLESQTWVTDTFKTDALNRTHDWQILLKVMERLPGVEPRQRQPSPAVLVYVGTPVNTRKRARVSPRVYDDEVYLVTALVPSDTACLASSPGRARRTAVWISRDVRVPFLL